MKNISHVKPSVSILSKRKSLQVDSLRLDNFMSTGAVTKRQKFDRSGNTGNAFRQDDDSDNYSTTASELTEDENGKEDYIDSDDEQNVSWIDKYAPKSTKEVAIRPIKAKEMRSAIEEIVSPNSSTRILLLTGPAGTSKTTILKTTFTEVYNYSFNAFNSVKHTGMESKPEVIEWSNQNTYIPRSAVNLFREFLTGVKYVGSNKDTLIIVKDLPNLTNISIREEFNKVLLEWLHDSIDYNNEDTPNHKPPCLAIVITEVEIPSEADSGSRNFVSSYMNPASLIAEQIFKKEVLLNPHLKRIKFNKVIKTQLKKLLTKIEKCEPKVFSKVVCNGGDVDQSIDYFSTFGDVRASIANFEFWAKSFSSLNNKKNQSNSKDTLKQMRRDVHLETFHAVGKVIYRSMNNRLGEPVEDNDIVVDDIVADWGANGLGDYQMMENLLFENMLPLNNQILGIDKALESAEAMSSCNIMTSHPIKYASANRVIAEIASQVEVRSLRYALLEALSKSKGSVYRRFTKMKGSVLYQKKKEASAQNLIQRLETMQIDCAQQNGIMIGLEPLVTYQKFYRDVIKNNKHVPSEVFESMLPDSDDDMFSEEDEKEEKISASVATAQDTVLDDFPRVPPSLVTEIKQQSLDLDGFDDDFDDDFDDETVQFLHKHLTQTMASPATN
ncbi:uncharacterized protein SAPINGB_P002778 [Magnusiomyces paraingens]|uniref:Checkpoint protein RAD24-like helical bundle domain-containing protein n=1 Tax=Magnusiomyces paraingens TaxID=2606893 RepID=A0A5E8BHX4_9ASCO|nr:uncharacterized protein SAPINGB_P002778 [Saprochaete ingens]VVT50482.1 unnamed protein product [Saprochaete ingens]